MSKQKMKVFVSLEFNRISIEVLSVVAVQVKCIQDAIKVKSFFFSFFLN